MQFTYKSFTGFDKKITLSYNDYLAYLDTILLELSWFDDSCWRNRRICLQKIRLCYIEDDDIGVWDCSVRGTDLTVRGVNLRDERGVFPYFKSSKLFIPIVVVQNIFPHYIFHENLQIWFVRVTINEKIRHLQNFYFPVVLGIS